MKPATSFVNLKPHLPVCIKPQYTINQHVSAQLYILSVALNIFIIMDVLWDSGDPLKLAFETADWRFRKPVCYAAKLPKNLSEPLMCVGCDFSGNYV